MKRWIAVIVLCLAMVSLSYAEDAKDITSSVKDRATGVAKEQATAYADDTTITSEVKLKLKKPVSLKDANISVSTTDGVVTLTGTVKSKQAKGVATKVAKAVKGVKSVDNNLSIEKSAKKAKKK